ncbi:hypothetical protein SAY86_024684 [Trapa natans]|uniref:Uncharacterized protein n=1 Tax=Trapa natans TaxID=22666 RepID=A0AAN7M747_TRANT|nr:hypothetical protein SAY86_024684 [Trapa natans]
MAWRCGSLPRTFTAAARASSSTFRSSPGLSRPLRPPSLSGTRVQSRRFSFASPRSHSTLETLIDVCVSMGELGCTMSLLPLHSAMCVPRLTSHLTVAARACCELSHGRNGKDG